MKVIYIDIIHNRLIEFKLTNRFWRIFLTKSTFLIESKNGGSIFKAYNFYIGADFLKVRKGQNSIEKVKKNMKEERLNLKEIMEG